MFTTIPLLNMDGHKEVRSGCWFRIGSSQICAGLYLCGFQVVGTVLRVVSVVSFLETRFLAREIQEIIFCNRTEDGHAPTYSGVLVITTLGQGPPQELDRLWRFCSILVLEWQCSYNRIAF